jgi:hypothetical protein
MFGTKFADQIRTTLPGRNTCRAYLNIVAESELRCEPNFADLFFKKDLAHVRKARSSLLLMVKLYESW